MSHCQKTGCTNMKLLANTEIFLNSRSEKQSKITAVYRIKREKKRSIYVTVNVYITDTKRRINSKPRDIARGVGSPRARAPGNESRCHSVIYRTLASSRACFHCIQLYLLQPPRGLFSYAHYN